MGWGAHATRGRSVNPNQSWCEGMACTLLVEPTVRCHPGGREGRAVAP
jgi:hypothetical protein